MKLIPKSCENIIMRPVNRITENAIIRRNDDILSSQIGDEAVILGIQSGNYFGFNDTGAEIWQYIEGRIKVQDLIMEFYSRYDGDQTLIRNDILDFLDYLHEKELIAVIDEDQV